MNARRSSTAQRGFTLLEALIALVLVAFGLLVLAGVNLKLARSEDVAKQRGEAARLAQEKIEQLRSFTRISSQPGTLAWNDLANGGDTIAEPVAPEYHTNTTFARSWTLQGTSADERTVSATRHLGS